MKNGLEHALILDKKGGAVEVSYEKLDEIDFENNLVWLHFDYSSDEAVQWITNKSGIDPIAIEALLTAETRPRTTILNESLLLALRGVNLNPNSNPEDMISIRIFINENLIITTKRRDLLSVNDIVDFLKRNDGPKSSSEFLVELSDRLTTRMQGTIEELDDRADALEEIVMDSSNIELKSEMSSIRREALTLRRYLSPQKEAMYKLLHDKIVWINEYERIQLREITDQLIRYIEELDTIKDKVSLIQEELVNKISEQMNNKMYLLSIISAIFLPLGFFTGLLGVNVGGIPGTENPNAFYIFSGFLVVVVILQFIYFRKKKWI
ncbi:zinc transporter ZntB [Malaciobacter pacificus]|uniref:Zinc transporter (EcCorA_ZntB-like family) n=1 Tax=Malaciobacter pacificus TaxID=1080223 RepID=A0A5C2H9E5_9BACT|nr:zinc transporter ZntB [Malaciobacter pacificus]QEP35600.1 zinc transporter (EcCorA_ZntB-like family) [Malaciobacter pacificus]GGD46054.1 zinc transporter ZntB [Malaciobacter pacificus]